VAQVAYKSLKEKPLGEIIAAPIRQKTPDLSRALSQDATDVDTKTDVDQHFHSTSAIASWLPLEPVNCYGFPEGTMIERQ
jgi:hypothetical protein